MYAGNNSNPKISVVATDGAGKSGTADFYVTVDSSLPRMTLDGSLAPPSPLDVGTGKWVEGPDQALRVLADDPSGSGPASATFAIDGTEIATRTQNCADFPCWLLADYSVDASVYAAGDHAAVVTVKDAVGNTKTYAWSIHVDPQPPDLTVGGSLDASEAHATSASPTYQLAIQASDGSGIPAQSGVDHVEVRIDDHTQGTVDSTCSLEPCTTSRTLEFTPQELAPGAHDVAALRTTAPGTPPREHGPSPRPPMLMCHVRHRRRLHR